VPRNFRDLTVGGEVDVGRHDRGRVIRVRARPAGETLVPGFGFDVVVSRSVRTVGAAPGPGAAGEPEVSEFVCTDDAVVARLDCGGAAADRLVNDRDAAVIHNERCQDARRQGDGSGRDDRPVRVEADLRGAVVAGVLLVEAVEVLRVGLRLLHGRLGVTGLG
jgi:hypothetical protein